jgi:hypothetical protein
MAHAVASGFTTLIAERIEAAHQILSARWLEQLKPLLPVPADDIFPGHRLGDMPALIRELRCSASIARCERSSRSSPNSKPRCCI